ncbi:hypothetical protein S100390_v1c04190 [Spiroplasma sp. NBRC 100390]|uniref:hypothetical protein n=1 Tax=unclassified Spiroplasma TaxID=2637901 RepID=UPI0008929EEF|nr:MULTISPECIES: hypothetical protein [unclassified Spiroplasma]AOX43762.1 hypothetical protein STU14_v1c04190 [Spiroplasma sp. TU-14]APE13232.1 hypothetical protein S100390_v1c04190 [Spiroplasma sp. NBRC 100390]
MAINLLKGLLGSLILTATPVGTTMSTVPDYSADVISPEGALFKMIKNSSTTVDMKTEWNYDGQKFYSQQELDSYIMQNNKVETIQTSSNPGKIINDYQYRTLDPTKVYDIDFNNYQLIYRDAYGNATLSKDIALETYTKNINLKYSYDAINWFDSPEEAKAGFIYKGGLHKSLYYYVNGRYYNAFNHADQKALKSVLTEGYNLAPSDFTGQIPIYGTRDSLRNVVANNFRTTWTNVNNINEPLNYANFLATTTSQTIFISPGNDNLIKVRVNGGSQKTYYAGETVEIFDPERKFTNWDFTYRSGWKPHVQMDDWIGSVGKYYYTRTFSSGNNTYELTYLPVKSGSAWHFNNFNWERVATSNKYDSTMMLYDNDVRSVTKKELYRWENLPINITRPSEIPTQYVRQAYDLWFNNFYEEKFLNLDKVDKNGVPYNEYGVKADILYDVNGQQGYKYSLNESAKYYEETLKPQILVGPTATNADGEITYKLRDDFYATKSQLDDYLFLTGIVDTRLMYTYLDVQDISSQDGLALAMTEADAREKQFQYEKEILLKKYFAFDVFGNSVISAESREDAIAKLHQTITLTGKYINRKEIASWDNGVMSYDNIIQDGVYNVYRIYSQLRADQGLIPYIYFDSYNSALVAIKAGINHEIKITTTTVNVYLYVYLDKNGNKHSYTYTSDEEINAIVAEIMQLS